MTEGERSSDATPPDLITFAQEWGGVQDQSLPAHHVTILKWLENALESRRRHLLLMAFRGAGKSTVVGLFIAWLLLIDPNRRVMVIAADTRLARKMVRNAQRIIERHPATGGLKPKGRGDWKADEFTVSRPRELRDPSVVARSVNGNFTGSRADFIICDDVEVPRTSDTAPKRADLRERLSEIDLVLVPDGTQLYVGTPHSYFSIYADTARPEVGETHPFLDGFDRLVMPVWDEDKVSAWPDVFTPDHIERLRKRNGPNRFAAQMLLQPTNLTAGRLDVGRLRHYDGEPEHGEAGGRPILTINGERMLSASVWWDPAMARANPDGQMGDSSVLAVVFAGEGNHFLLHRIHYITTSLQDPAPEATQQCRQVVAVLRELNLPAIHVETNGLGTFLPGLLREELRKAKVFASVIDENSRTPKDKRIVEAFDALLADGRLLAHRGVWDTPFVREMREWRPGRDKVPDDGLDAVAGALSCEPWRFDRSTSAPCRPADDWRGAGVVIAPSEWEP